MSSQINIQFNANFGGKYGMVEERSSDENNK